MSGPLDANQAGAPATHGGVDEFMKAMRYQAVRQSTLMRSIDFRVEKAQNNVITVPVFFEGDMDLVREYMRDRYPSMNFNLKLVEP